MEKPKNRALKSQTTVDYISEESMLTAAENRPAEAAAEISVHLPAMPRGGNLVTSRIRFTLRNTLFLELNPVI